MRSKKRKKKKEKKKKKKEEEEKKRKKKVHSCFCNFSTFHFQFSTFIFTIFHLFFSVFTPFPFFPCLFFPNRSAEISWSEVPPACYATGAHRNCILFQGLKSEKGRFFFQNHITFTGIQICIILLSEVNLTESVWIFIFRIFLTSKRTSLFYVFRKKLRSQLLPE